MKQRFKGIIFDLDGTLINSFLDFNQMRKEIGIKSQSPVLEFIERSDDQDFKKWAHQIVLKHEIAGAQKSEWIEGAHEFIQSIHRKGLKSAILTRNCKEATNIMVQKHNIPIEFILTREDCQPKPHPEGILTILKKWDLRPAEALYIGDFLFDLHTARRAQTHFALYYSQGQAPEFAKESDFSFNDYKSFTQKIL